MMSYITFGLFLFSTIPLWLILFEGPRFATGLKYFFVYLLAGLFILFLTRVFKIYFAGASPLFLALSICVSTKKARNNKKSKAVFKQQIDENPEIAHKKKE